MEIDYTILRAALEGQRKTRIMYQSRLNLKQLNQRLGILNECSLVSYISAEHRYVTTERGRAFTKAYERRNEIAELLAQQEKELARYLSIARERKPVVVPV